MDWKKKRFQDFKLYAITDLKTSDPKIFEKFEAAFRGGADIIQIRSKTLSDHEMLKIAQRAKLIAENQKKLLFINDRADLALAAEADGVHVGQDDLPVAAIQALAKRSGKNLWVGKSTHSLEQALKAESEGADYIGVGPIFETPTKPGRRPVGLELISQVNSKIRIPFVAIGGIDSSNIHQVLAAGAARIAVVRAIFNQKDIYHAAKSLHEKISERAKALA